MFHTLPLFYFHRHILSVAVTQSCCFPPMVAFPKGSFGKQWDFVTNTCLRNIWQKRSCNVFLLVVETTVLLDDLKDYGTVNEIYSNCKLLYSKYWCVQVSEILLLMIMTVIKIADFNPGVTSLRMRELYYQCPAGIDFLNVNNKDT